MAISPPLDSQLVGSKPLVSRRPTPALLVPVAIFCLWYHHAGCRRVHDNIHGGLKRGARRRVTMDGPRLSRTGHPPSWWCSWPIRALVLWYAAGRHNHVGQHPDERPSVDRLPSSFSLQNSTDLRAFGFRLALPEPPFPPCVFWQQPSPESSFSGAGASLSRQATHRLGPGLRWKPN